MNRLIDLIAFIPRYVGLLSVKEQTDPTQAIIDKLDNFDILLFSGKNYWFSYIVEYATWSKFSHIGIVLKSPTWLDPELTGDYLLESGIEDVPDSVTHKKVFGVQITPLHHLIKNYSGDIYVRKFESLPYKVNPQYYHEKVNIIYKIVANKPYDDQIADLVRTEFHIKLGNCQRTDSFFCSALVSFIFTQLGLLPTDCQWDLIEPKDFDTNGKVEQLLMVQKMAAFGPVTQLSFYISTNNSNDSNNVASVGK